MTEPASVGLLASLGINATYFVAQLINFSIVLVVMWKWVYTPLLKIMDKRAKDIADGLANAKRAESALVDAQAEKDRIVSDARAEAHALIEETRAKAEAIRAEKMTLAKKEIETAVEEAKERIKGEKLAAFESLKGEIGNLVALATEKVASGINDKDRKTLVEKAVSDLSGS